MSHRLLSVRHTRSAPVIDLFEQGLSFRLMLFWKTLPPLSTMNEFLACGRDDTDAEDGLVEWEPVELTQAEYGRIVRALRRRGHDVVLDRTPAGTPAPSYEKWFASHLAKRERKPTIRKRFERT